MIDNNIIGFMKKYYVYTILIAILYNLVLFEILVGTLQLIKMTDSLTPTNIIRGNFYNTGPYACFLSVIFPIVLRMSSGISNNKFQKWVGMGIVLCCAILIPATMSRTAIIACVIGGSIALSCKWNLKRLGKTKLLITGVFCVIIAGGIYLIKKESADGRFLMWKVAAQAVMEVPPTGVGWTHVAGTYGEAQEKYFALGNGSEQEILVADAPEYVFNEYFQIAIAYGPAVAIMTVALITGGFIIAVRNKNYGFAGSIAAVATVMFASYPLQFPLFAVTIALILIGGWLSSPSGIISFTATAIIVVITCLFLTHSETRDVRNDFAVAHSLHRGRNYRKSNALLIGMLPQSADPMILNIIGKNYQSLGMGDSAEYYLQKSVNRCPNRLYPHYLLMQLYGDTSYLNPAARQREARILLDMKEKIPSPAVEEMREEAKSVLECKK